LMVEISKKGPVREGQAIIMPWSLEHIMPETSAQDWITHKGKASKLGLVVRQTILDEMPGIKENLDLKGSFVTYGIGDGHEDTVVIIRSAGQTWTIGFYRGRELPDPERLLGGGGRLHAAVIVGRRADIESEAMKDLLKEAYAAAVKRKLEREPPKPGENGNHIA
jgi:hypothetical protein